MVDKDMMVRKKFVQTLGRLGIVDRSYFLIFGINWVFPHGVPHGQDDGRTK